MPYYPSSCYSSSLPVLELIFFTCWALARSLEKALVSLASVSISRLEAEGLLVLLSSLELDLELVLELDLELDLLAIRSANYFYYCFYY